MVGTWRPCYHCSPGLLCCGLSSIKSQSLSYIFFFFSFVSVRCAFIVFFFVVAQCTPVWRPCIGTCTRASTQHYPYRLDRTVLLHNFAAYWETRGKLILSHRFGHNDIHYQLAVVSGKFEMNRCQKNSFSCIVCYLNVIPLGIFFSFSVDK